PLLDELQVLIELEQLRGRGAARRADVAAAGEDIQVTLRVLRYTDRFADGVTRNCQPENFLGDLELRCVLLERVLARECGLLFRAGSLRRGGRRLCLSASALCVAGCRAEQQHDENDD